MYSVFDVRDTQCPLHSIAGPVDHAYPIPHKDSHPPPDCPALNSPNTSPNHGTFSKTLQGTLWKLHMPL